MVATYQFLERLNDYFGEITCKWKIMTTKEKLKKYFDTEQNELKLIEKYEENITFFNELLKNGHKEDLEYVISIKMYNYANSLQKKGYYSKSFKVLNEIEKDLGRIKGLSKWYDMYLEGVLFFKGVCLGRLRKYRESNQYFAKLIKKKPTNDNFVDWYKSNKKHQIEEKSNIIVIIAGSIAIISIILNVMKLGVPIIIEVITFTTVVLTWLTSFIWKKIIDKQEIKL